ncbi:ferritin-like domain-containing protein [bacterium]|nr:MAG: ferritin-like domain-containing protein [bacterium]
METLQELYEDSIKDIYNAEKQFLKAMPKLLKAARNESLKKAIESHIEQTKGQVARLEEAAKLGGFKPTGKVCLAAKGLVEETEEHLKEGKPGPVMDAAIVACAQKNEHYEIGTYGTIITWAEELGLKDAAKLLKDSLAEEESTDKQLSAVAKAEVNKQALSVVVEPPAPKKASSKSAKSGRASLK